MKRLLSVLLVLSMLCAACLSLASCNHTCEFLESFSMDATHHWHACAGEDCNQVKDMDTHTWDEGTVTSPSTPWADGVKTFTCTVCSQTKTEPVTQRPHTCVFSDTWAKNANCHWRFCTVSGCEQVAELSAHTWDEGVISTGATSGAVKTFTCTVCYQTKTESAPSAGMTETEWNNVFADENFENFAYCEISSVKGSGVTVDTESRCKLTSDGGWVKIVVAGQSDEQYVSTEGEADALRDSVVSSLKSLAQYEKFEYDAESNTYLATSAIFFEALNTSTSDVTLTFAEGKLAKVEYTATFVQDGIEFTTESTITVSDYGTVVLPPPAQ